MLHSHSHDVLYPNLISTFLFQGWVGSLIWQQQPRWYFMTGRGVKFPFFVPPPRLLSKFFDIMYTIFWNLDTKMSETTYSWTYLQWSFIWPSVCRSIMQVLNFLDWNIFLIQVLTISNKKYLCIIYQLYVVAKHGPRDVNHFSTCNFMCHYSIYGSVVEL